MNLLLDLTIIIPNYNTKALLRQCLASIYRYTRDIQFEVICIDDGSSDGSPEMVESDFPEVILVRNPVPLLYSKNNNLGMKMSRARYASWETSLRLWSPLWMLTRRLRHVVRGCSIRMAPHSRVCAVLPALGP
jgi:GT2 family glycosyltransferase